MRVYAGEVEERKAAAVEMLPTTTATSCSSKVEEAGRLPSIETEPKTLTLDQIKYAREAALYVVSTKTEEEAIRIFTAGLKPVQVNTTASSNGRRSNSNKSSSMDSSSDDDVDLGCSGGGLDGDVGSNTGGRDCTKGGRRRREGRRQPHSIDDIRDIATAPF